MKEIKNLEELRIEIAYKKKKLDTEIKMVENGENKVKDIIEKIEKVKVELKFMNCFCFINKYNSIL